MLQTWSDHKLRKLLKMQNNIKVLLIDFSYTLLFPKSKDIIDSLNGLYSEIKKSDSKANPLESFILNQQLLDYLKTLKSKYKIYIFTSGFIHTDPIFSQYLQPIFDGYITSSELKLPKSFPDVYKIIANKVGVNVGQILFIDDQQKNVSAALTAGAKAIIFSNNTELIKILNSFIWYVL